MTIRFHASTFAGLPVVDAVTGGELRIEDGDLARAEQVAWRVALDPEADRAESVRLLDRLFDRVGAERVRALVIGDWGSAYDAPAPIPELVERAPWLSGLRALFLGEMTFEECEISWIQQGDVTPLLTAYPELVTLWVRGGEKLELSPVRHAALRSLGFESGGLPAAVVQAVGSCELPSLGHLELWLGTAMYGGDATVGDLEGVLTGGSMPDLRYLGLRDAQIADAVAEALSSAPVVARLEELDLSLGTLTDAGALALLGGQPLTHLRRLNLTHHYLSEKVAAAFESRLAGVEVDLSDRQEDDHLDRYVAVSE